MVISIDRLELLSCVSALISLLSRVTERVTDLESASGELRTYFPKYLFLPRLTLVRADESVATFGNERLLDRIKIMAGDPHVDESVRRTLFSVLISWRNQFKDDPRMSLVAGLYDQLKVSSLLS